jgi:hypothetical protein
MRHAQVEQRRFKELVAKVRSRYQISMRESVERSHSPQASAWGMAALGTQEPFQR